MVFRFLLSCAIICVLFGCTSPVVQSVDSGKNRRPTKLETPEVNDQKAAKLEIIADDVKRDDKQQTMTFTGNVDMRHPDFRLQCDHLFIHLNQGAVEPEVPLKQAIGTGARVVVERTSGKGVREKGVARRAVFDPKTGNIVLSGGRPVLTSGGTEIKTDSPDAIIILRKDGSVSIREKPVPPIPEPGIPNLRMITHDPTGSV